MAVPVPAEAGGGRQRALAAGSPVDYMSITSFPRLPEEEAGGAAEGGLRARKEEDAFLGEQDTGEGGGGRARPRPRMPPGPRRPPLVPSRSPAPPAASSRPGPGSPQTALPAGPRGSPSPGPRLPLSLVYLAGPAGSQGYQGLARG